MRLIFDAWAIGEKIIFFNDENFRSTVFTKQVHNYHNSLPYYYASVVQQPRLACSVTGLIRARLTIASISQSYNHNKSIPLATAAQLSNGGLKRLTAISCTCMTKMSHFNSANKGSHNKYNNYGVAKESGLAPIYSPQLHVASQPHPYPCAQHLTGNGDDHMTMHAIMQQHIRATLYYVSAHNIIIKHNIIIHMHSIIHVCLCIHVYLSLAWLEVIP